MVEWKVTCFNMTVKRPENTIKNQLVFILIVASFLYVPFLNKALHMDSDMAVHVAMQLLENPINPPAGDYGNNMAFHNKTSMPEESVYHRCPHPPLFPFLLTPWIKIAGPKEWVLHLFLFSIYIAAILGGWRFFGLFFQNQQRFYATILWTVSPALVVNSHNIMYDVPVVALLLWSIVFGVEGFRNESARLLVISGVLLGFGALTKMTVAPLYATVIIFFANKRKWNMLWYVVVPAVIIPGMWVIHNLLVFGKIQYISTNHLHPLLGDIRYRLERIAAYTGGAIIFPVFLPILALYNKKRFFSFIPFALSSLVWAVLLVLYLNKSVAFALSYAFFAASGGWIMMQTVYTFYLKKKSPYDKGEGIFLLLFFLFNCGMMLFLPLAAVRFILPIVPIILIVIVEMSVSFGKYQRSFLYSIIGATMLLTCALSIADYLYCQADRAAPDLLRSKSIPPEKTWYFGRLSFDYYLHNAGYKKMIADSGTVATDDFIFEETVPGDYSPLTLFKFDSRVLPVDTISLLPFPLRTIGYGAGFYGNGRLPYIVGKSRFQKEFVIYRVVASSESLQEKDVVHGK